MLLVDDYRTDNAWVGQWTTGSWNDPAEMAKYIEAAYNLYAATARNALQLTLLGGTEIRMDDHYVKSFGITAANGIQDEETVKCVQRALLQRGITALTARANTPGKFAAPVTGTGSILSEKRWTPILNDSLILGAITSRQPFYLALTPEEQRDWTAANAAKVTKVSVLAANYDNSAVIKAWKDFLNAHELMFFGPWGPRVFARELLGLKWFGYRPVFSWHQLGFEPTSGSPSPSFRTYVLKLRSVGFQDKNKQLIKAELSRFLFNDATSLGPNWT